ncbi:hypothetical protein ACF8OH_15050 [Delftia sp. WSY_9]|jgi:hypothetical protein|uniref:hypothetical protein n=1 Tax=unclassified Delftia TaxID=2613839 RepID=UPI00370CB5A2
MQKPDDAPEPCEREVPQEGIRLDHRLICGLRFDEHWQYRRRTESGHTSWTQLPMASDPVAPADPYGVWWCVRRCTVVLEQRSWLFLQLPTHLPAVAGVQEMAQILDVLMPDCNVQAHAQCAETHLLCAHAVEQAGSALLMLESPECDGPKPSIFWAWVVGYEPQLPLPCTEDCVAPDTWQPLDIQAMAPPQALLVLPFDWTIPWSSGYPTRIQVQADGSCHLQNAEGPWHPCRWLGTVTLGARTAPA